MDALRETPDLPVAPRRVLWSTLTSELIFFILYQYISFSGFVEKLLIQVDRLPEAAKSGPGREELSWALLQYISGSIGKNPITEFACALKLYRALYWEKEPIPPPDVKSSEAVR